MTDAESVRELALPAFGDWKSRLSVDFDRQGFKDDRTSFTRGHANYRATTTTAERKMWLSADLNWLGQEPASPHVREGAALSTATPLDANYNPADACDSSRCMAAAIPSCAPKIDDPATSTRAPAPGPVAACTRPIPWLPPSRRWA